MVVNPLRVLSISEETALEGFRDRVRAGEGVPQLIAELGQSLEDRSHNTRFYLEALQLLNQIGVEARSILIRALENENRWVSREAVKLLVDLSRAEKEPILGALWDFLHGSDLIEPVDYALDAIVAIMGDESEVFTSLIGDDRILDWQRGSIIVNNTSLRGHLEERWERYRDGALPLILKALECENPKVKAPVVRWFVHASGRLSIPEGAREKVVAALHAHFKEARQDDFGQLYEMLHKPAFALLEQMGAEVAIDRLISDRQINSAFLGSLLLRDAGEFLEQRWRAPDQKEILLPLILAPVQDPNRENRLAATSWLAKRVEEIPWDSRAEVASVMETRLRDDDDPDVRGSADQVLIQLRQRERARDEQTKQWLEMIRKGDEDSQVRAIEGLVKMESRRALRVLIQEWVHWIAWGNKALLVESTAEAIRSSRFAVLPLVDKLSQGYKLHPDLVKEIAGPLKDETDEAIKAVVNAEHEKRSTIVRRRIAKQLADMSDPRFKDDQNRQAFDDVREELGRHAVPSLGRQLEQEDDFDVRESMAYVLGNVGGPAAVDGLARAVVGEERKRAHRQKLLADYYLEPSKSRSEEAAQILNDAVEQAKNTLRLLQGLNVAVFAVGVILLVAGVTIALATEDGATRVASVLAGIGGFVGVITQLIRDPLDRIQNAMANLVQIETAFTSFIWELNLNSTFIQSQYVAKGILAGDEVAETVDRIERGMNLAMNLVAAYTKEGSQRIVTRISKLSPGAGEPGSIVTVHGQHLQGDSSQKKEQAGLIAIDHTPVQAEDVRWTEHQVRFKLPSEDPRVQSAGGTIWISLYVDGMETNALPFHIVRKQGKD